MNGFTLELDTDGIALVTFDLEGKVNIMNDQFMDVMETLTADLEAKSASAKLTGIILTSAKSTFFAGGDLDLMRRAGKGDEAFLFAHFERLKGYFRRLEKLGKPVVAAINGTALGGGYELCLACHYRIGLRKERAVVGLPEINFGILPAAGGVIRLSHRLGLPRALDYLITGRHLEMEAALSEGLIDALCDDVEAMLIAARQWIHDNPEPVQPWDVANAGATSLITDYAAADWLEKTYGRSDLAAIRIAGIAMQSLQTGFDTISPIETEGFVELLLTDTAQERITTFFNKTDQAKSA